MTTPDNITELAPNEIFVFGSNLGGNHAAGAAAYAQKHFGAEPGIGEGMTGQSYALPTLGKLFEHRNDEQLTMSVRRFFKVAREHPDQTFLVTKVGCGIAGYDEDYIKLLFYKQPANVVLPAGWDTSNKYEK